MDQRAATFIRYLEKYAEAHVFDHAHKRELLRDISFPTALESGAGNWQAVVHYLGWPGISASLADLTAAFMFGFNNHIFPSTVQPNTLSKKWANCSLVVTWSVARKVVDLLLPM